MLFLIKNRDNLEKLDKLSSLQNQVKALRLQIRHGKQNFQEYLKEIFEPFAELIKDVSEDVKKL